MTKKETSASWMIRPGVTQSSLSVPETMPVTKLRPPLDVTNPDPLSPGQTDPFCATALNVPSVETEVIEGRMTAS